ncbi:MAG TPA: cytochrome c3 family protein [Thermoanaerobaculaceae bacterium]|nr:cytochrome c3 family protein [Thermoanaerobaculaceae bacterium]
MTWQPFRARGPVVAVLVVGWAWSARAGEPLTIDPNHAGHVKAGLECLTCHETIFDETALGQPGAFPKESKCLGCHKKEKEAGKCGMCHLNADKPGTYPKREPYLIMNHAKHLEKDEKCEVCHLTLPARGQVEKPVPPMKTCLSCHNHDDQFKNGQCYACHLDLTHFPLKPETAFSHTINFTRVHPTTARSTSAACETCHQQQFCADCHAARTRPMKVEEILPDRPDRNFIHWGDFLTRHSIEARGNEAACQKCHPVSFCADCHKKQRLTPDSNNPLNPHPSGWLTTGSPSFHGTAARRDIVSCASCHEQGAASNCVSCHRVGGPGGDPHPFGWTGKHPASEINRNSMCLSCHP